MVRKRQKKIEFKKRTKLERQYKRFLKRPVQLPNNLSSDWLEQPSPLRIVPSVATGAAFTEPAKMS
ncbi:MAG: hypothetical protein FJ004_05245 [Chloroflexi bacterium]|nr:hypothetical protein [Chloroflexota bacterium]